MSTKSNTIRSVFLASVLALSFSLAPDVKAAQSPQVILPGKNIPQFVDPLPALHTIVAGTGQIELQMNEFQFQTMPSTWAAANPAYTGTWVWGYREPGQANSESNIGPVIVASRGTPTEIKYVNNLGSAATTNVLAYKYSTDQTIHWADPLKQMDMSGTVPAPGSIGASNYNDVIPAVPHLHGGEVPPVLDGGPEAWFTSDGAKQGATFYSKDGAKSNYSIYRYPNAQEAAPIWFHDHTLGATRLNVYAGLAGAYLITDPNLTLPLGLTATGLQQVPAGTETPVTPLVIQDRMFDTSGQLFFPSDSAGGVQYALNPEHPYWVPEFVGDTIVVNGKVWPFMNVEPKRYRFLLLNGSNARTYELSLPFPIWVIGTDGGYLDAPVSVSKLLMQPGERYDIIIDFGKSAGKNIILTNTARTPFPKGASPDPMTVGRIIQFRVGPRAAGFVDSSYNPAAGTAIRTGANGIVRLVNPGSGTLAAGVTPGVTRQLTLNEVMGMAVTAVNPVTGATTKYPGGPLEILVNNSKYHGERMNPASGLMEPIPGSIPDGFGNNLTELPREGDTEIWEFINLTADTHPIHLHLAQFQLLNRQTFNAGNYNKAYNAAFPAGAFIPAYGPPLAYNTPNASGAVGGNPDIAPFLLGKPMPPLANEAGWKDTIMTNPGEVTRIAVRWAPTDKPVNDPNLTFPFDPNANGQGYVWHCHIIDHEDNEMMRPDEIVPSATATRTYIQGVDY